MLAILASCLAPFRSLSVDSSSIQPATVHVPVLPQEVLQWGAAAAEQTWVDGTAGGGGHCRLLADAIGPHGRLLAMDRDSQVAEKLTKQLSASATVVHDSYENVPEQLSALGWHTAHGILLDLGLSSDQLADRQRGFSFQSDGDLDMRFDTSQGEPVWKWLQHVNEKTLADTIYQFGEERFSRRIARRIVETRRTEPIRKADQLRELIYRCVPRPRSRGPRTSPRLDPATRTFQALRIQINDELGILKRALARLPACLEPDGVLLIISFHSLEDRLVKYAFRDDPRLQVVTKKPVQAGEDELQANSRARSAKLRVARRSDSP